MPLFAPSLQFYAIEEISHVDDTSLRTLRMYMKTRRLIWINSCPRGLFDSDGNALKLCKLSFHEAINCPGRKLSRRLL